MARAALVAYAVLLTYGSLAPWQGWRSLGVSPFAFVSAPWPAYITSFDLTLNVLAYLPLGMLLTLALYPRPRGLPAIVVAVAVGAVFSLLIETVQNYLPTRIASNLDLLTNTVGTVLGAIAGAAFAPALIAHGRLQQARRRWFGPEVGPLLLIVALWPLAQMHPGPMLFGNGEINRDLVAALLGFFGRRISEFDASQFAAAEVLATAAGMLAAGASLAAGMNRRAPRLRLILLLLATALATKAITYGHEFGPSRAMAWLTPGAISGLAVGLLAVIAAAAAPPRTACLVAVTALLVLIVTVNAVPPNPYHTHWLSAWHPGRMRDVAAASDWLAQAWPYVMLATALWWLLRIHRQLRSVRGQ